MPSVDPVRARHARRRGNDRGDCRRADGRALRAWQRAVVDALVAAAPPVPTPGPAFAGALGESQARYGWPFVGEHWIPHFTVASVPAERSDPLVGACLALPLDFRFAADSAALCGIRGDAHVVVARVALGSG
ncbi:MAG: hypothetical protein IPJ41_17920 [Phycisphaerales bacterium]|nr:hypothetical protein [Phycisphaerales bacterium]